MKNMWPTFEEFKRELEIWLKSRHPKYLNEIGDRGWMNNFVGKHHSKVLIIISNYNFLIK